MYLSFQRITSKLLPLILGGTLLVSTGPAVLRAVGEASLLLAQISVELCQMGLVVLHVCGI
jgi:hypothetical protein